jgi:hypothetical protein
MLNYKTLFGDLLVFKNKNDCMTINRCSSTGLPWIEDIEVDGEPIEANRKNNYSVAYDEKNPFSPKEIIYFLDHYEEIVGRKY